ncbi:ribitol kinase [Coprinopsis sp. MPI-PUGE-AT-0042]|nr:ribitol kinase [Coprinopsis sp. MPI-PUGE-AT-0042]
MSSPSPLYIGIDVGTGSVRAALVQQDGQLLATASQEIKTWRSSHDHRIFEQSTKDIWDKICGVVKRCVEEAGSKTSADDVAARVQGIGFDATCSLAVVDDAGKEVIVTEGSEIGQFGERNIILWADHRAEKEAEVINKTGSVVLDYVGGKISLEMEIPKILWLKNHMPPSQFSKCQFFDLPDFLTYSATGGDKSRSHCSLACKCSYVVGVDGTVKRRSGSPPSSDAAFGGRGQGATNEAEGEGGKGGGRESGWDDEFFKTIGLGELVERGYDQIAPPPSSPPGLSSSAPSNTTSEILTAGIPVGSSGLSSQAAQEMGLREGIAVGSAVIDAYAGWLGTVGARCYETGSVLKGEVLEGKPSLEEAKKRLAVVAGTSTCHIVQSRDGIFVDGIWGPYRDPIFPGWWMNEGGQSSTGQLIDHIITTHPAYPELVEKAKQDGVDMFKVLHDTLERLKVEKGVNSSTELTKDLHLYPDFHGNRSPIADPRMTGSITGLTLSSSLSSLALLYHATLTAIALQTRQIVERLNEKGHAVDKIYVSGSQARNGVLMGLIGDCCAGEGVVSGDAREGEGKTRVKGVVIAESDADEAKHAKGGVSAVVLGAAMLGRMAHEVKDGGEREDEKVAERLWNIMTEMTPPGVFIPVKNDEASLKERRILEVNLEVQRKWRDMMDAVV